MNTNQIKSNNKQAQTKTNSPCLKIIPLGGLHEIGKNTCVFEYGDDIILIDGGLAFPSDGMHGSKCCHARYNLFAG